MRGCVFGALIRCKGDMVVRVKTANSLISFKSSPMAQPVLISDPDPNDTDTNQHPVWARNLIR